jgi:hypothetical protein
MPKTIISVAGYVRKVSGIIPATDEILVFRGHSRRFYKLLPTVLRDPRVSAAEGNIYRELVAAHPAEFASDRTTLEHLVRMQHYTLPTRLLDMTADPLVALYFAAKHHTGEGGDVVVLRIKKKLIKFSDSDTASCLANLALLSAEGKNSIDFTKIGIGDFNEQDAIDRLLQAIRSEKPHFRDRIVPADLKRVLYIKPKINNNRIFAQSGAFLLFGLTPSLESKPVPGITIAKIHINGAHKTNIIFELDHIGINESTMFPEIESAARYITGKI